MNNEEEDKRQINNISCTHVEGTKKSPISWSTHSKFHNDYCASALVCMAFPTLFPYKKGDWFNQERRVEVSLVEYNKHMLKYSMKNPNIENDELSPTYLYLSAEHDRWVKCAQNISEGHRLNG